MAAFVPNLGNGELSFLIDISHLHGVGPNDRDPLKLFVPAKNTKQARFSIFYAGARGWNRIPSVIRCSKSLNILKANYKMHLLNNLKC